MTDAQGYPTVRLEPLPTPGRTEIPRELLLKYTIKVGRAVANKVKPSHTNAIFDSKVLSRSHAEIWVDDQKVYIKDTKSSNGTYLNDERLSTCGKYSEPFELKTGDILKLGVDVTENSTAAHKCVSLKVVVSHPAREQSPACQQNNAADDLWIPVSVLVQQGDDAICKEITSLRERCDVRKKEMQDMSKALGDAVANERSLSKQLQSLSSIVSSLDKRAKDAYGSTLQEDKLLSRLDVMEAQLAFYMSRSSTTSSDEVSALRQQAVADLNARHEYEMNAKVLLKRTIDEKGEVVQKLNDLQREIATSQTGLDVQVRENQQTIETLLAEKAELIATVKEHQSLAEDLAKSMAQLRAETDAKEKQRAAEASGASPTAPSDDPTATTPRRQPPATDGPTIAHAMVQREFTLQDTGASEEAVPTAYQLLTAQLRTLKPKLSEGTISVEEFFTELDAGGIGAVAREITETPEVLVAHEQQLAELQARVDEAERVRSALETQVEHMQATIDENDKTRAAYEQQMADLRASVDETAQARATLATQLEQLQTTVDESQKAGTASEEQLAHLRSTVEAKDQANTALEAQLEQTTSTLHTAQAALSAAQSAASANTGVTATAALEQQRDALDARLQEAERRCAAVETQAAAAARAQAQALTDAHAAAAAPLEAEVASLRMTLDNQRRTEKDLNEQVQILTDAESALKAERDELGKRVFAAEKAKETAALELRAAQDHVKRLKREKSDAVRRAEAAASTHKSDVERLETLKTSLAKREAPLTPRASQQKSLDDAKAQVRQLQGDVKHSTAECEQLRRQVRALKASAEAVPAPVQPVATVVPAVAVGFVAFVCGGILTALQQNM